MVPASRARTNSQTTQWLAVTAVVVLLPGLAKSAGAVPPPGYYDPADAASATTLRGTLHQIIRDHKRFPYTSLTQTDTWDIFETADEDADDSGRIVDLYENASCPKSGDDQGGLLWKFVPRQLELDERRRLADLDWAPGRCGGTGKKVQVEKKISKGAANGQIALAMSAGPVPDPRGRAAHPPHLLHPGTP